MALEWQCDEVKVAEICGMFMAASSPDMQVQQKVLQCLDQCNQLPDFIMYLVAVFARVEQPEVVRQRAGLMLKTRIQGLPAAGLHAGVVEHINGQALAALQDSCRVIRQTAGTVLTTMVQKVDLQVCGPALQKLVELLGSAAQQARQVAPGQQQEAVAAALEGALGALCKISEDELGSRRSELFATWAARDSVLQRVFECAVPASPPEVRRLAIECLNHFALNGAFTDGRCPELQPAAAIYIEVLGVLANDPTPEVLQQVCKGFVGVVEAQWSCISDQHYRAILQFMLAASAHRDYAVRLEALSVWVPCSEECCNVDSPTLWELLRTVVPELVPVLLANMVYADADYMCMERSHLEEDNAMCPDSLDDIKPRFHKACGKNLDGDEDDDDGRPAGKDWGAEWTVRKAAASSLDRLASFFPDEVLQSVLPHIQQKLEEPVWEQQESAVLALGAIALGCLQRLVKFLPAVMKLLVGLCNGQKPLLRSISCWTISRYSNWLCHDSNPNREQLVGTVLKTLLRRCLDRNKRVQEAAISALATLEESALGQLVPFLDEIVETLARCFKLYQVKNTRILYDAIGTLAWAVGSELDRPQHVQALLVPIMQKFDTTPDNDITTLALFECLSILATNLRTSMLPVIPKFTSRCARIVQEVARAAQLYKQNPNEYEQPDRELMAASIDLLAGIMNGLREHSREVLSQHNFLVVLPDAMKDSSMRVKQSGYALMGVCATLCVDALVPLLPALMPLCAAGLQPGTLNTVSHNASWAIGEVCVRVGPAVMGPHLEVVVPPLLALLLRKDTLDLKPWQLQAHRTLVGNVCITIGRLGLVCPDEMAKGLPNFLRRWSEVALGLRFDVDKVNAFKGICSMIRVNPQAMLQHFGAVASAIVSLCPAPPLLEPEFREILQGSRAALGSQWPSVWSGLREDVQLRLQHMYQLTMQ